MPSIPFSGLGIRRSRSPSESDMFPVKRPRTFTAANGAYPDINFYAEPINVIQKLSTYLIQGKFCLVYGHRQSGKTAAVYATARWLACHSTQIEIGGFGRGLQIYVISFNGGIQLERGVDEFWLTICRKLKALDKDRFFFNESEPISTTTFETFFRRKQESLPVVLVFDESSALLNHDRKIIEDFMGVLRLLKDGHDQFCLHSFALVGIETIKKLLTPLPNSKNRISPFTAEATVEPDRFIEADIKMLLDDYARESSVELESADIAKDIFERTLGHAKVSLDDWKCATVTLADVMAQRDTYASIIRSLKNLSSEQQNIIGNILRYGSHRLVEDENVRFLLAEGMIFITYRDGNAVVTECAAPVLRDIMISHINGPTFKVERPPNTDRLDVRWLLDHAIKNMAVQHVFADQATNFNGQPSEYTFQVEFNITIRRLLAVAYPRLFYRVISEAKERDECGMAALPRYGFELVEATHGVFDEHCRRADYYRKLHDCSMFVVNLCAQNILSGHFGPILPGVTPMHVIYDVQKGLAELVFRDSRKSVSIEGSAWQVVFS
ncbi:1377_t:CDS:2 [Ambispora gerdemannii]|uniref:1377_t:CDS:1 n=1 Tax=Ambispora gerdemannii TaxID=144530 RepID=A0A9N9CDZ9_9GLOM|nr:1377_t:CDS:2 [Ambispora gerdemannii]